MGSSALTAAKRRLLDWLKVSGPATATEIAAALDLTSVAVRQHLTALEAEDLVRQRAQASSGRGRPSAIWETTRQADGLFPDRHGELTVGLLRSMRQVFGERGLERIVAARAQQQAEEYRRLLPGPAATPEARVEALAAQRSREGYMAEARRDENGDLLLIEHHCPICEAAESCTGLCTAELEVFRAGLGSDLEVERVAHLLSGDTRCVYRIRPAHPGRRPDGRRSAAAARRG